MRKGRTADSASAEEGYDALKRYARDLTQAARDGREQFRANSFERHSLLADDLHAHLIVGGRARDGARLDASGFFRVEKYRGKWWFVDPDRPLFWSHGIDCVGALDTTPVGERAGWFEDFAGDFYL